jgi:hypothetical protein
MYESYLSNTGAVISVWMMPGRNSNTAIPKFGEPGRKQLVEHRQGCFGNAVVGAVFADHRCIDRADRDDGLPRRWLGTNHSLGDRLRQEEGATQVDGDGPVKTFRCQVQHVATDQRRHTRIVDQARDGTEVSLDLVEQLRVTRKIRDVARVIPCLGLLQQFLCAVWWRGLEARGRDRESGAMEGTCDSETKPSPSPRYKRGSAFRHPIWCCLVA